MSALQKLMFHIGVSDGASGKMLGLQKAVDRTCRSVRQDFEGIKAGALTAAGAGMSLYQMVNPAVDFNRAVGEVRSLGTGEDALAYLQTSAKQFAMQYGGSAAEVVRSSYDIQSAIAGLEGKELGTFAMASATLAKGTKADSATITAYMGTMYGIYKQQADKMGRAQWVEQLTGRTAYAVQIFKTTGMEMSSAFTALGANAQAAGISAQEQMAVLGMLQSTMSGSEAGTKYKAFLAGVGSAQKELGLKFTDKSGNMLGMDRILEKIRGKFGDTLSVNESDLLKKAFGSDEAVSLIKLLYNDTSNLKKNIADIGRINNMDQAKTMAKSMTDIWARLGGAWDVVRITFAQRMLPTIEKVTEKIVGFLTYIQKCMDIAPGLTGKLGIIVAGAIALAGVMGILGLVVAANKLAFLGITTIFGPLFGMLGKLKMLITIVKFAFWAFAFVGTYLAMVFKMMATGALKFAAALLANPITWVVLGIMALVGAVVALVYYWSDLVAWFSNTSWGKVLITMFQDLRQWWNALTAVFADGTWIQILMGLLDSAMSPLRALGDSIGVMFQNLRQWWSDLTTAFTDGTWAQTLMGLLDTIMAPLRALGDGIGWIGEKLGIISGEAPKVEASGVAALAAPRQSQILPGGVAGQISNATNNNGKTVTIGSITIQPQTMPTLDEFEGMGYTA